MGLKLSRARTTAGNPESDATYTEQHREVEFVSKTMVTAIVKDGVQEDCIG
jgi:hypothetical protein